MGRSDPMQGIAFRKAERELISARTRQALALRKAEGARLGRPRTMASDTIERIVRERADGATFASIAEGLNRDAVPTARGGASWYPSTVRAALESVELDRQATGE